MKPEDLKNYSEFIKNIVLALGLFVGGIWALYTFGAKLEMENAKAKLESVNQSLISRAILVPTIKVSAINNKQENIWYLKTIITIENKGNTDASIRWDEDPLIVAKVKFENGSVAGFENRTYASEISIVPKKYVGPTAPFDKPWVSNEAFVLSKQTKNFQFMTKVFSPGVYLVQFMGYPSRNIEETRSTVEQTAKGIDTIAVSDHIFIAAPPNKANSADAKSRAAD